MNRLITTALGICLVASYAGAQSKRPAITPQGRIDNMSKIWKTRGISSQDRQFLMDASASNWMEIRTSQMAESRATGPWAKHFAADMIADHKAADAELRQLARKQGIALPAKPPAMVESMVSRLAKMNGPTFDSTYREIQIRGHEMTVAKLSNEIKNGHDTDVRSFAVKMLPVVEQHLKAARMHTTITHPS